MTDDEDLTFIEVLVDSYLTRGFDRGLCTRRKDGLVLLAPLPEGNDPVSSELQRILRGVQAFAHQHETLLRRGGLSMRMDGTPRRQQALYVSEVIDAILTASGASYWDRHAEALRALARDCNTEPELLVALVAVLVSQWFLPTLVIPLTDEAGPKGCGEFVRAVNAFENAPDDRTGLIKQG